jgi:hypothetical protein
MSAVPQPASRPLRDQEVLGELLHSISQPLTSLRCSLELSVGEVAEQQQEAVSIALEHTDQVIGMVKLMREYLDAEPRALSSPVLIAPVVRSVVEQLASVADARQVQLQLAGTCTATIPLAEPQIQLALQYLVGVFIEGQPPNSTVTLQWEEISAASLLRARVEPTSSPVGCSTRGRASQCEPVGSTLRHVKLAIARRVLESAGARLESNSDPPGFALRIPRLP